MPTFRLAKTGFRFNALHSFPADDGYDRFSHGHDYELTVMLEGELDGGGDGMLFDLRGLKTLVDACIIAPLDHRNLDAVLEHPSLEMLAQWIWNQLRPQIPAPLRLGLRLWETRSLYVEFWGK